MSFTHEITPFNRNTAKSRYRYSMTNAKDDLVMESILIIFTE